MSNKKLNAAIISAVLLLATAILVTPMKIANGNYSYRHPQINQDQLEV
ncbi:MAG: hypothetical protein WBZ36_08715 [Candidatus Nitrosopolaris sp.]